MANIDNVQLPDGSSYNIVDNTSGFATQNYVNSAVDSITKTTIGLGNVDDTSDLDKPVSTAQQTALDAKVNKSGDTMSGALTIDLANGTTSARGNSNLTLGNATPSGTAGNSRGQLFIFGDGSYSAALCATNLTAHRNFELPDKGGTIALEPTEESGSLVSYMQSGFTGNDVSYYKKGNIATIRSNGAAPNATGASQVFLTLPSTLKAKMQTFAVVTGAGGSVQGLAYISGQNVIINVSAIGPMYFSLMYQC